jgi:catechol 2,3-dioxygenase-like lactoylglutathione lyase family enzyme
MARPPGVVNLSAVIRSIAHAQVMIPVGREDDARAFYCGLLGLVEIPKPQPLAARGGLWLAVGEQQLHLGVERDFRDRSGAREHVAYAVDDLDAWRRKLEAAGVPCRTGEQIPGFVRLELRDPFGNRIELLQPT